MGQTRKVLADLGDLFHGQGYRCLPLVLAGEPQYLLYVLKMSGEERTDVFRVGPSGSFWA